MKGRKPVPTALKILRGNPGRRPLNTDEPEPAAMTDLTPPDWLDQEARAEWARMAPILGRLGVLTETDGSALVGYCQAYSTWKAAMLNTVKFGTVIKSRGRTKTDKDGSVTVTDGVPIISPYVKIAHNAGIQMRAYLVEFGMTPSSRARVSRAAPQQADNPLERYLNRSRA